MSRAAWSLRLSLCVRGVTSTATLTSVQGKLPLNWFEALFKQTPACHGQAVRLMCTVQTLNCNVCPPRVEDSWLCVAPAGVDPRRFGGRRWRPVT